MSEGSIDRIVERHAFGPKAVIIEFGECGDVVCERPLYSGSGGPALQGATACRVAAGKDKSSAAELGVESRQIVCAVLVVFPGNSAFAVNQEMIPGIANAPGCR